MEDQERSLLESIEHEMEELETEAEQAVEGGKGELQNLDKMRKVCFQCPITILTTCKKFAHCNDIGNQRPNRRSAQQTVRYTRSQIPKQKEDSFESSERSGISRIWKSGGCE